MERYSRGIGKVRCREQQYPRQNSQRDEPKLGIDNVPWSDAVDLHPVADLESAGE